MEFPAVALSFILALRISPLASGSKLQPHMPNVCAEQELAVVGQQQPCVRALTRAVKVWKQDCGGRRWCSGYERRITTFLSLHELDHARAHVGEKSVELSGVGLARAGLDRAPGTKRILVDWSLVPVNGFLSFFWNTTLSFIMC
ncbi:hypothetical protein BTVI_153810 [Pitangus sulphuratus]|nr:hypothetical protein BTVI_153810 [Pitangus sulphuratus]